jgi:hypothetical protein
MCHTLNPEAHYLVRPMAWCDLIKTIKKFIMIVDHITHFVDIRILLVFFLFFHPSCMFIVSFINRNMFWACRRCSVMNEMASLWKSLFIFSIPCASYLQHFCQSVKILYDTNIFYEVLCKVLYHNVLTTHGLENPLICLQPGPERARSGRCNMYFLRYF